MVKRDEKDREESELDWLRNSLSLCLLSVSLLRGSDFLSNREERGHSLSVAEERFL